MSACAALGSDTVATSDDGGLDAGAFVAERLQILGELGRGAWGRVLICRDIELGNQIFALRCVEISALAQRDASARFRNDLQRSHRIADLHVLRSYWHFRDGQRLYVVSELAEGGSLSRQLSARTGPIGIAKVLPLLIQIAKGARAIHSAGMVHAALHPRNILLDTNGGVKLKGFEYAVDEKCVAARDPRAPLSLLSPEAAQGSKQDRRSDVYAIGALGIGLLGGRFSSGPDGSPLELAGPMALGRILIRATLPCPGNRFQSADELLAELETLQASLTLSLSGSRAREISKRHQQPELL